jgi:hypothetical protein
MSKTENIFSPRNCPFCIKGEFCWHRAHENHNKGKCLCCEGLCPRIERAAAEAPAPSAKELTDEIKAFRQKNKEFSATNDHEFYWIVSFSCKQDKEAAGKALGISDHTLVDGYELMKRAGLKPDRPSFELREPFKKRSPL